MPFSDNFKGKPPILSIFFWAQAPPYGVKTPLGLPPDPRLHAQCYTVHVNTHTTPGQQAHCAGTGDFLS